MRTVLVINSGSSSVKASLFRIDQVDLRLVRHAVLDGMGTDHPKFRLKDFESNAEKRGPADMVIPDHKSAIAKIISAFRADDPGLSPCCIGHRVVHGGLHNDRPVLIDAEQRMRLDSLVALAPLHLPGNIAGIDAASREFPGTPQIACFDTAFHRGRAFVSETYGLPRSLFNRGYRRYGFHGLSYESIVEQLSSVSPQLAAGRIVVAHFGNGASLCAIRAGKCVETTMGYTALDGMPMGTRCGELDPGIIFALQMQENATVSQLIQLTHQESGMLGLSEISSDMRQLLTSDDPRAKDAVDYYVHRATYYIGALAATMGGMDGLVFTAGIGENARPIRERICTNLAWLGMRLDPFANEGNGPLITAPESRPSAWVLKTNEELMIARHAVAIIEAKQS